MRAGIICQGIPGAGMPGPAESWLVQDCEYAANGGFGRRCNRAGGWCSAATRFRDCSRGDDRGFPRECGWPVWVWTWDALKVWARVQRTRRHGTKTTANPKQTGTSGLKGSRWRSSFGQGCHLPARTSWSFPFREIAIWAPWLLHQPGSRTPKGHS